MKKLILALAFLCMAGVASACFEYEQGYRLGYKTYKYTHSEEWEVCKKWAKENGGKPPKEVFDCGWKAGEKQAIKDLRERKNK